MSRFSSLLHNRLRLRIGKQIHLAKKHKATKEIFRGFVFFVGDFLSYSTAVDDHDLSIHKAVAVANHKSSVFG